HRKYVLRLTGATIEPRQLAANDDVWIERIGDNVTIFLRRNRTPVAKRDLALIAAGFDSDGTAFLLSAVKPIWKRVVRAHVIQLRCRLFLPRDSALSAVLSHDLVLVRAHQNVVGSVRINAHVLIIVLSG